MGENKIEWGFIVVISILIICFLLFITIVSFAMNSAINNKNICESHGYYSPGFGDNYDIINIEPGYIKCTNYSYDKNHELNRGAEIFRRE